MDSLSDKKTSPEALADVVVGTASAADGVQNTSVKNVSAVDQVSSAHVVVGDESSSQEVNSTDSIISQNLSPSLGHNKNKLNYAAAAKRRGIPSFAQSVVCDAVEGATNDDYMDEFEKLFPISQLSFFSKISENRACFTLNSVELAKKCLECKIKLQGQVLSFRPLQPGVTVYKYKRFVISNILPQIPNDVIIDKLKTLGFTTKNGITNIRCSSAKDPRKHVQSHRRQFYVKEEDAAKLPAKIKIVYEEIPYWVFLGADEIKCHFCKSTGHVAKYCPSLLRDANNAGDKGGELFLSPPYLPASEQTQVEPPTETTQNTGGEDHLFSDLEVDEIPENLNHATGSKKRPASVSTHSSVDLCRTDFYPFAVPSNVVPSAQKQLDRERRQRRKKVKTNAGSPKSSSEKKDFSASETESDGYLSSESGGYLTHDVTVKALEPIRALFHDSSVLTPMNFDNFTCYVTESKGKHNIVEITEKFTDDAPGLITFLDTAIGLVADPTCKNRLKNLNKRLRKAIDNAIWPSDAKKLARSELSQNLINK